MLEIVNVYRFGQLRLQRTTNGFCEEWSVLAIREHVDGEDLVLSLRGSAGRQDEWTLRDMATVESEWSIVGGREESLRDHLEGVCAELEEAIRTRPTELLASLDPRRVPHVNHEEPHEWLDRRLPLTMALPHDTQSRLSARWQHRGLSEELLQKLRRDEQYWK